jgi:hypothetical protein
VIGPSLRVENALDRQVDALGGREDVTDRSENARFTRSDRAESLADALSSRVFALVARNDAPCASDMRVRSPVMPHSSPAGRVRLMKEATFTQQERDRSTFERVSSSKKAVRSRSRRVFGTTKPDYVRNKPISQTNKGVFTSNQRVFRPKKVVRRPDQAVSPFNQAVRRPIQVAGPT